MKGVDKMFGANGVVPTHGILSEERVIHGGLATAHWFMRLSCDNLGEFLSSQIGKVYSFFQSTCVNF